MTEPITCSLCQKIRQPAMLRMWGPDGSTLEAAPWCRSCEHKNTRHKGRAEAYVAFLMRDWDGSTVRRCPTCKDEHPDVLFPYTKSNGGTVIARRRRCISCRSREYRRGIETFRALLGTASAFDVTHAWIAQSTGRTIERWTFDEHNAQCILMREMTGLPHHIPRITNTHLTGATAVPPMFPADYSRQEALWRKRLQAVVSQYVPSANDWKMWHVG